MRIGMLGLGRMGAGMVRRLMAAGHECVVFDVQPAAVAALAKEGAIPSASMAEFASNLRSSSGAPRVAWMMIPVALVDETIAKLAPHLARGDILIDGGNSYYKDDLRRAHELEAHGIRYLDVGVSGGVWGLERGYCQMIGGDRAAYAIVEPAFRALAPTRDTAPPTPGREGRASTEIGRAHV